MTTISPLLRTKLHKQRADMFAEATHPFALVARAVNFPPNEDYLLARAALRSWWIEQCGDLLQEWELTVGTEIAQRIANLKAQVAQQSQQSTWIKPDLLARTVDVLQQRRLRPVSIASAVRTLVNVRKFAALTGGKP